MFGLSFYFLFWAAGIWLENHIDPQTTENFSSFWTRCKLIFMLSSCVMNSITPPSLWGGWEFYYKSILQANHIICRIIFLHAKHAPNVRGKYIILFIYDGMKGSLGAMVRDVPCDLKVMGSSRGIGH